MTKEYLKLAEKQLRTARKLGRVEQIEIEIDDDIWEWVKTFAKENKVSKNTVINAALLMYLDAQETT